MSQPLFVRRLTRTERVEIKRLRRKPPSIETALRAQAVLLSRQRRTVQEIGDIIGRNRSTVFRWLQAFNRKGLDSLWPGKSPGAPPKADAEYQAVDLRFQLRPDRIARRDNGGQGGVGQRYGWSPEPRHFGDTTIQQLQLKVLAHA